MGAGRRVKYYVSTAFLETSEVVEIAKAARSSVTTEWVFRTTSSTSKS